MQSERPKSPQAILLEAEAKRLVADELYKDPKIFFAWIQKLKDDTSKIGGIEGGSIALSVGDLVYREDNSDEVFGNIINHMESLGIKSEVQSLTLKYHAIEVISKYFDRLGLGFEKKTI